MAIEQQPPVVLAMILADTVVHDLSTDKMTIQGTYQAVEAETFPYTHPAIVVYVALTEGYGETKVQLRCGEEKVSGTFLSRAKKRCQEPFCRSRRGEPMKARIARPSSCLFLVPSVLVWLVPSVALADPIPAGAGPEFDCGLPAGHITCQWTEDSPYFGHFVVKHPGAVTATHSPLKTDNTHTSPSGFWRVVLTTLTETDGGAAGVDMVKLIGTMQHIKPPDPGDDPFGEKYNYTLEIKAAEGKDKDRDPDLDFATKSHKPHFDLYFSEVRKGDAALFLDGTDKKRGRSSFS